MIQRFSDTVPRRRLKPRPALPKKLHPRDEAALNPSLAPAHPCTAAGVAGRLAQLRSEPRQPGEASFFFHDPHFDTAAVKILPGEYFVAGDDLPLLTTLGSCIAACLWDGQAGIGGMNHFMLPEGSTGSGRYGPHAMELLVDEMVKQGARRAHLEAKVFGGGHVIAGMGTLNVGERNTAFVLGYLKTERIPLVASDVLDVCARRVCFLPASGQALVKRLPVARPDALPAQEPEAPVRPFIYLAHRTRP